MNEYESIKNKLKKLLALAERGVQGRAGHQVVQLRGRAES